MRQNGEQLSLDGTNLLSSLLGSADHVIPGPPFKNHVSPIAKKCVIYVKGIQNDTHIGNIFIDIIMR